jgi:hypothetical protein
MGTPRILVEGGPVDLRLKRLTAVLVGLIVGLLIALIVLFTISIKASRSAHEAMLAVRQSRINATYRTCREANERHLTAKIGIEAIVRKTAPHKQSPKQHVLLEMFVTALAPSYNCPQRVAELARSVR